MTPLTIEQLDHGEFHATHHRRNSWCGLQRLRHRLHLHRLRRKLRPRALRRVLKKVALDEQQLDQLLRAQRQLTALRMSIDDQRRELQWSLLAVILDPELQREQAVNELRQLTRRLDEQAAELIMSLAEFGASLDDEQRRTIKHWLAQA